MSKYFSVSSVSEAWSLANKLFPTDYEQDESASKNAGYPIFRSTSKSLQNAWYNYICDLGCRLEINLCGADWSSETIDIMIEEPAIEEPAKPATTFYLCDKITGEILVTFTCDNFSFDGGTFEFFENGHKIGECFPDLKRFYYSISMN